MRLTLWLTRKVNQEVNQDFMKASVSVICYKHKVLANGESPLMLRVFESSDNAELALVKLMELFNHSSVTITKRYLGLKQEEILQTYDCLNF